MDFDGGKFGFVRHGECRFSPSLSHWLMPAVTYIAGSQKVKKELDAAQEVLIEMQCLLQNCPSPQAVCTFRKLELACVQSSEANHHIKDACMFGSAVLPLLFFACASAIVQILGQRSKDAGDCIMFQL